jgi:hypothetical protein
MTTQTTNCTTKGCDETVEVYNGPTEQKKNTAFCPHHGRFTVKAAKNPVAPADPEAEAVAARGNVASASSGGNPSEAQSEAGPKATDTLAKAVPPETRANPATHPTDAAPGTGRGPAL